MFFGFPFCWFFVFCWLCFIFSGWFCVFFFSLGVVCFGHELLDLKRCCWGFVRLWLGDLLEIQFQGLYIHGLANEFYIRSAVLKAPICQDFAVMISSAWKLILTLYRSSKSEQTNERTPRFMLIWLVHRADCWRYVKLDRPEGACRHLPMALVLVDLDTSLEILGFRFLRNLRMSRGAKQKHINLSYLRFPWEVPVEATFKSPEVFKKSKKYAKARVFANESWHAYEWQ